jgi:hypothetical protein
MAQKQAGAQNVISVTEGANQDLELESIHGSDDGEQTGHGQDSAPKVAKQSKA